ncbi:DNA replication and repair protein RecF [Ferruginibacter lapsinanis]|uniref:DNA replication/repair protein RecF n=1 Tax=Ferruginibacter lapsinanis TaxID=563172 RepID=UPI001E29FCC9|nr:DNA replication and repair protein RecF [Ferruginibacter lapsinanis]UEG49403.1 DNA replication and repair protein RecF [Ferruginibacter lapsinanis]
MLQLSKITITQFKNYDFSSFDFTERVIGICGLNGKGKTNLLDAVYYLCFTKSYFSKTENLNTQFNADGFRLEGKLNAYKIVSVYKGVGKKEFSLNDVPYSKYSEHIGKFPAVMIAPDDIELITGGSEERRRFVDTVLSQMDANYLQQLIVYTKVLQQRNSLLKRFAEQGKTDWALLEVLDEQLIDPGQYIYAKRSEFTAELIPLVQKFYNQIANNNELVTLVYESQLNGSSFESVLKQFREKDCVLQRSNGGIHKDDISIQLNGQVFKNIASQGQRKSLLFALKLAEFELLKQSKGFAPLLLLDDVFEKLDDDRMQNLLHWVCNKNEGQVFITDTHRDRLEAAFTQLKTPFQIIEL